MESEGKNTDKEDDDAGGCCGGGCCCGFCGC